MAVNAHPALDPWISNAQSLLAATIAVVGSLALVLEQLQRPVQDVWQAGREAGRREAIREARASASSLTKARRRREAKLRRIG